MPRPPVTVTKPRGVRGNRYRDPPVKVTKPRGVWGNRKPSGVWGTVTKPRGVWGNCYRVWGPADTSPGEEPNPFSE